MNKPIITICTVNYNSSEFIENMLYALKKLTFYPYRVIIRDNNSRKDDYDNLKRIIKENYYDNVELYRVETLSVGSLAHGEALNDLYPKITTKYGVIIDADATFLVSDWDKILIDRMSESMPIYGTRSDSLVGRNRNFPQIYGIIFNTKVLQSLIVDFRPGDIGKQEDTGWSLQGRYEGSGLKGGLLYDFSTRDFKLGPFSSIICAEYYLSSVADDPVFFCHFGRGSAPKAKNLIKVQMSRNIFLRLLNKILQSFNIIKWSMDKKKWISICRDLIDKQ